MLRHTSARQSKLFRPDYIARAVSEIDFSYLAAQGLTTALIDLDGTVVARGTYDVDESIRTALRSQPLSIYIATNRPKSRDLKDLKDALNASGVLHPRGFWGKPFTRYYRQALNDIGKPASEVIMIGDRYLQDIFGANRAGLQTLGVYKLDTPANWFDRLISSLERRYTNRISKDYTETR